MTTKKITYQELEKAIRLTFVDDKKIYSLYDRNANVHNIDDLVVNVLGKIKTYEYATYKGAYVKNNLVGYIVYEGSSLISFGLSVEYRGRKYKEDFFPVIKRDLPKPFFCSLWSRNIRAVKWLQSHGCTINNSNPSQTQLVYV